MELKNVLSCFDGASCAQMALKRSGIKYKNYYASEINSNSIVVTQHNFPNTIQLGSVTEVNVKNLPKIDIIFAGSPCTDFSKMGKQEGMVTQCGLPINTYDDYIKYKKQGKKFKGQSYLFWEFIRLVKELKPKYFFLENTKMPNIYLYIITKELGVEPIFVNSSILTAQNRERYYWTNLPGFKEPKDKKIMLSDIIPGAVASGYRGRKLKGDDFYTRMYTKRTDGKANCLVTRPDSTNLYDIKGKVHKVTIEQAEQLQTWPKGYTNVKGVSKASRYEMIGNGWTVDVIAHFLRCAKKF